MKFCIFVNFQNKVSIQAWFVEGTKLNWFILVVKSSSHYHILHSVWKFEKLYFVFNMHFVSHGGEMLCTLFMAFVWLHSMYTA